MSELLHYSAVYSFTGFNSRMPTCSSLDPDPDLELELGSVVDVQRYPITSKSSTKYTTLVESSRAALQAMGSASFPGFIRADVIASMAEEVSDLPAHNRLEVKNLYGVNAEAYKDRDFPNGTELDRGHPLVRKFAQDVHAVANDCIPTDALINKVYNSPIVTQFLADVLGIDTLYQFDDEFQKLNIMYIYDSGNRGWHFDGSDFVVTLMLQPSLEGGEFEFSPFLRGPQIFDGKGGFTRDENYEGVRKVINGENASTFNTQVKQSAAGTLNLFYGMRSLHRVRSVFGPRKRIMSVLSYHREPNQCSTPAMNISLYGDRVREIYLRREQGEDIKHTIEE